MNNNNNANKSNDSYLRDLGYTATIPYYILFDRDLNAHHLRLIGIIDQMESNPNPKVQAEFSYQWFADQIGVEKREAMRIAKTVKDKNYIKHFQKADGHWRWGMVKKEVVAKDGGVSDYATPPCQITPPPPMAKNATLNIDLNTTVIKTTTTETSQDLKDFISGQNPKVVVSEIIISEPVDKRLLLAKEQRPDCYTELEAKEFLLQCAFHLGMGDHEKFNQSQQVSGLCKIILGGTFQAPKGYNKNKLTPDQKRQTEISQQLARKQAANKPKHITQTATEYLEQIKSAFRSPSNAT